MKKNLGAFLSGLVALSCVGSVAEAQDLGFGAHAMPTHGMARATARWDTYGYTGAHDQTGGSYGATSFDNVLSAQADFRTFVLNFAVPIAWGHGWVNALGTTTSDSQAELGNIELEGFANIDLGPEHRLLIGGGIALPTATDQLNPMTARLASGIAVRQSAWHTSFRNPAAWADQSFGIWASAAYRFQSEWVLIQATGSIPFFLPTHGDYGGAVLAPVYPGSGDPTVARGNVEVMFQLDASASLRLAQIVDVGVSFLGWALPSATGLSGKPDLGQTALSFFARTDDALDLPVGGGVEAIIDLDDAWGPTGGDQRYWGLHFFLYGRFDIGEGGTVTTEDLHPDVDRSTPVTPWDQGGDGASTTTTSDTSSTP